MVGGVLGGAEEWALLEDLKISNFALEIHVLRNIVLANFSEVSLLEFVVLAEDLVLAGAVERLPLLFPGAGRLQIQFHI